MSRRTFSIPGGIHPPENKHQSLTRPIEPAGIPAQLILPLSQHIGAPAKAIVKVGDKVLKGQKIAEANGFVSVPLHAPSSGVISAIEMRPIIHSSGLEARCIVIDTDGQDQWIELKTIEDYSQLDKRELLAMIREAGIAGMGGAGFPSAVKLGGKPDTPIDTLIINATECEPYITADDSLIQQRSSNIVNGIKILQHLVSPKETIIGIEDNKPEAIVILQGACRGHGIEVVSFPTKYPSGGEKQLIKIITGKEVPSGGLPADIGILMQNIGTAAAINDAITLGRPLISRITTVTGEAVDQPQNFDALLGSPISFLLKCAGFQAQKASRIIIGGPMMGIAVTHSAVPVVKTTNCILVPSHSECGTELPAQACIRCGSCAEACPVSLLPQQMYWFAKAGELDKLEAHNIADCIECGCCDYVCPSNIPLVQYYRAGKGDIRTKKLEAEKSEHAKQRFEFREERLAKAAAEKEAKRAARAQAAKDAAAKKAAAADDPSTASPTSSDKSDVIAAALARSQAKKAAGNSNDKADLISAAVARSQAKKASANAQPVSTGDPVQDAIAKAQAKRASGAVTETPEEKLGKLEQRLSKAQHKLDAAIANGQDNIDAFRTGVEKTQQKVDEARAAVAAEQAERAAKATTATVSDDPVAAAIAKAQAKRAGGVTTESPQEKVDKLTKRLDKAQQKLDAAIANGQDNIDAFRVGVEKSQQKLDAAKAELDAQTPPVSAPEPPTAPVSDDPVAAAIAKAQAKRAGGGSVESKEDKVAKLTKRLAMAEQKLALAKTENSENTAAFQAGVDKLKAKLTEATADTPQAE